VRERLQSGARYSAMEARGFLFCGNNLPVVSTRTPKTHALFRFILGYL